jgi:hypothetical protein
MDITKDTENDDSTMDMIGNTLANFDVSCYKCKHFHDNEITCDAFPNGVPDSIMTSSVRHDHPINGDHGIQFEPIPNKNQ